MLILDLLWNYSGWCGGGVGVGKTVIILLTQSSRAGAWTELGKNIFENGQAKLRTQCHQVKKVISSLSCIQSIPTISCFKA